MQIAPGRFSNPERVDAPPIMRALGERPRVVIQFNNSSAYYAAKLTVLDGMCERFGSKLEVRFFAHYGQRFDASVLRHLPHVGNVSLDALTAIDHLDVLVELDRLERLRFGVFEFDEPRFLERLPLERFTDLCLIENRKRNFDLRPLARCGKLERLLVNGHWRGIEAVAGLPNLADVTLSAYARSHGLAFLNALPRLEHLMLILGGRDDIDDLTSTTLAHLEIVRVLGFKGLGDLTRFPSLRALRVEDQKQLTRVDLTGADLRSIQFSNCRNLAELAGLEDQRNLESFGAGEIALDLDALRDFAWPPSARVVRLFSGSRKWNEATRAALDARGLRQSVPRA